MSPLSVDKYQFYPGRSSVMPAKAGIQEVLLFADFACEGKKGILSIL
jgi:hypothetical protein